MTSESFISISQTTSSVKKKEKYYIYSLSVLIFVHNIAIINTLGILLEFQSKGLR